MPNRHSPGNRDDNEKEIIAALRKAGAHVIQLDENAGADLLVAYHGALVILEVKNPEQPPSKRRLTPSELELRDTIENVYFVVETAQDALDALWDVT